MYYVLYVLINFFYIFQVPHSAMTEQERARQCEMAHARRARFNVRHGRPGHLPSHEDEDQDQEGEDQDREMDDENREPREGEAPSSAFCHQRWSLPDSSSTSPVDSPPTIVAWHHSRSPPWSCPRNVGSRRGEPLLWGWSTTTCLRMSSQDRTPAVETVSLWTVSWCRPASVLITWGLCISASGLSILLSKWVGQPSSTTDRLTSWSPLHSRLSAVCARRMRTRDSCWRLWGQLSPLPSASARIPSVETTRMRRVFRRWWIRLTLPQKFHAGRVNTQYVELKKLKDSLPTTSLLLQMDFAENFSCSSGPRNVQSSCWNPQTVTLHPIMVYYHETVGGELLRKSFCYMSSVPSHNTTMVVTILKSLLLTELRPLIDHLDINKVY